MIPIAGSEKPVGLNFSQTARPSGEAAPSERYWALGIGCAGIIALYLTSLHSYLLFHTLAEIFTVVVAFSIFVIAWNSRRYTHNGYLLFVGIAYLALGTLDLLHTLGYAGMPVFPGYPFVANQLWIAARFLESLSLLAAFVYLGTERQPDPRLLLSGFVLVTSLIIASIFFWHIFPVCFVAGQGQTRFKILSEYAIIAILAVDVGLLIHNRFRFQRSIYLALLTAMLLAILTEGAFTVYVSNYGPSNMVGHYLKVFSYACIYVAIVKNGVERPYELIFRELTEVNERLTAEAAAHQITLKERALAEGSAREREQLLRLSLEGADLGAWDRDIPSGAITVNRRWAEMLGFGLEDLDATHLSTWEDRIHPDDRPGVMANLQAHLRGETPSYESEYRMRHKSGDWVWILDKARVIDRSKTGEPLRICGTHLDITERKWRSLIEEARVRLVEFAAIHRLDSLMQATLDEAGALSDSPIGFYHFIGEDEQTITLHAWSTRTEREFCTATGKGSHYPLQQAGVWADSLRQRRALIHNDYPSMPNRKGLPEGHSPVVREMVVPLFRGSRIVAIMGVGNKPEPYTDKDLQLVQRLADVSWSLTERKRIEDEKQILERQFQHSQKMEGLGVLSGGVAHDMNNVLGAILGLASAHIGNHPSGSPLHQALDTIIKAAERGGKMVKSLLGFARQSPVENIKLDMNAILREQVALLERTTMAKVRLEMDLETDLLPILGDAAALTHAFMNLCVNAVDAMPENGTLTLHTRNIDNNWIEVVVEDNGIGMPKEVLEKATDPFFTTKETGKGTGLGLSMVFSTVKAHRGRMTIESEPSKGTRVKLHFPAYEMEAPVAAPTVAEAAQISKRTMKVLVVDDDELIQSSTLAILEVMGHTAATTAQSGEEALALVEAGLEPDLVILDMNMPGLGGAGTLPRLRVLLPTVPVLLATGRVDQTALTLASMHPGVTLLPKPFGLSELQKLLESIGLG